MNFNSWKTAIIIILVGLLLTVGASYTVYPGASFGQTLAGITGYASAFFASIFISSALIWILSGKLVSPSLSFSISAFSFFIKEITSALIFFHIPENLVFLVIIGIIIVSIVIIIVMRRIKKKEQKDEQES